MSDAVVSRLAAIVPGRLGGPGVAAFRRKYASAEAVAPFVDFATNPVTVSVRAMLKDLALHPARVAGDDASVAVQHGMTLGLSLAAQLLEDPSAVMPDLFSTGAKEDVKPPYETSADEYIDQI